MRYSKEIDRNDKKDRAINLIISQKPATCFSRLNLKSDYTYLNKLISNKHSDIMNIYYNNFSIFDGCHFKHPLLPITHSKKESIISKSTKLVNIFKKTLTIQNKNDVHCVTYDKSLSLKTEGSYRKFESSDSIDPFSKTKAKLLPSSNFFITSYNKNSTRESNILKTINIRQNSRNLSNLFNHTNSKSFFYSKINSDISPSFLRKENKIYLFSESLKKRISNKNILLGKIENISEYNTKVNNKIKSESKNSIKFTNCPNFIESKQGEYDSLKNDFQKNTQLRKEVKNRKGIFQFISQDKANLFKVSDSVSKMNEASCFNFKKIIFDRYRDVAQQSDQLEDYKFIRFLKKHPVKKDKVIQKHLKIKILKKSVIKTYQNALNIRGNFVFEKSNEMLIKPTFGYKKQTFLKTM